MQKKEHVIKELKENVKAVVFDVDGTLYPNSAMYVRIIPYIVKNFNFIKHMVKIRKDIRKIDAIDNLYDMQVEMLAQNANIESSEALEKINRIFYADWEARLKDIRLFKDCIDVVKKIKLAGYKLGILSDFPVLNKMQTIGFPNIWDFELSSETINYLKPRKEPFLEIIRILDMSPTNILYIGNSYKYDIIGSKSIGMYAGHISFFKKKNSIADFTFYYYRDLLEWLSIE